MFLTQENLWLLLLAGAGTGILGALLGTGGGVFLIPILVLALDLPMHHAIATSIITVVATSSAVASANVERGTANMRLGMTLEMATALGALTGAYSAAYLAPRFLEGFFALVLLPTAFFLFRGKGENAVSVADPTTAPTTPGAPTGSLDGSYFDALEGRTIVYHVRRLWAGFGISFLAGNLSGLLGIGGGVFKVPALNLACGVPIKAAAATSNFMIGVTAATSAFLYYHRGEVRPALTAAVILGVLAGSIAGSMLNRWVRGDAVRKLFAFLLIAVAVQMFIRATMGV